MGLVFNKQSKLTRSRCCLNSNNKLSTEETHARLRERFERGSITVACSTVMTRPRNLELKLVCGIRNLITLLVGK